MEEKSKIKTVPLSDKDVDASDEYDDLTDEQRLLKFLTEQDDQDAQSEELTQAIARLEAEFFSEEDTENDLHEFDDYVFKSGSKNQAMHQSALQGLQEPRLKQLGAISGKHIRDFVSDHMELSDPVELDDDEIIKAISQDYRQYKGLEDQRTTGTHTNELVRKHLSDAVPAPNMKEHRSRQAKQKFANSIVSWYYKSLKDNDYSLEKFKNKTVLQEAVDQRLIGEFRAAQMALNLSPKDASVYFDRLRDRAFGTENKIEAIEKVEKLVAPTVAPALYKEREDEAETPAAFMIRVYGSWAQTGLTRRAIGDLDPTLIRALYREDIPSEIDRLFPKSLGGRPKKKLSQQEQEAEVEKKRAANRERVRKHRERQRNLQ